MSLGVNPMRITDCKYLSIPRRPQIKSKPFVA